MWLTHVYKTDRIREENTETEVTDMDGCGSTDRSSRRDGGKPIRMRQQMSITGT